MCFMINESWCSNAEVISQFCSPDPECLTSLSQVRRAVAAAHELWKSTRPPTGPPWHSQDCGTPVLGLPHCSVARSCTAHQCLIQDKISTSPSPTDRRAVVTLRGRHAARSSRRAVAHGRHIGRYFYLIMLPLLIILLSLKSNFIIL